MEGSFPSGPHWGAKSVEISSLQESIARIRMVLPVTGRDFAGSGHRVHSADHFLVAESHVFPPLLNQIFAVIREVRHGL
jgi:hypothetical protein